MMPRFRLVQQLFAGMELPCDLIAVEITGPILAVPLVP
jgi:hypothetical protein